MKEAINKEEEDVIVDLKDYKKPHLALAGGEPPILGGTWLRGLDLGTVFLVREKITAHNLRPNYVLGLFRVVEKSSKSVVLQAPSVQGNLYVDPDGFCKVYDLYENFGTLATEDQEKENAENADDGDRIPRDPTVPPGKVE